MLGKNLPPMIIIEPAGSNIKAAISSIRNLWAYRQLWLFLCWRDLLIRYKRTALGFSWLIFRPVVSVAILTFVFKSLAKLSSGNVNYLAYALAGYLFWQLFSTYLSEAGNSLLNSSSLITKVYFPRLLLPLSYLASVTLDFVVSFLLLVVVMIATNTTFHLSIVWLPIGYLWVAIFSIGVAMVYSPFVAKYRDIRYALPFLLQMAMFASPVGYSQNMVTGRLGTLYYLNPLAGIISFGRWVLFNETLRPDLWLSIAVTVVIFVFGLVIFQRRAASLADVL